MVFLQMAGRNKNTQKERNPSIIGDQSTHQVSQVQWEHRRGQGQAEDCGCRAQPCLTKLKQPFLPHTNSLILQVFGDSNILTELSFYLGLGFPVQGLFQVLWQLGSIESCQFSVTILIFFHFPHFEAICEVPYVVQSRKSSLIILLLFIPTKTPQRF